MKRIRLFFGITIVSLACLSFASCNSYYYCTVNSYGSSPEAKTYYVTPIDSSMLENPFLYQEYKQVLVKRLNELGYVQEKDSSYAAIIIQWSYYFGDKYFAGTETRQMTNNYGWSNNNTSSNTNISAYGTSSTNRYKNTTNAKASVNGSSSTNTRSYGNTYNLSTTTSTEDAIYQYDLGCIIMAFDNNTYEPIWSVETIDHSRSESSLREAMKWAITAACLRIGNNDTQEVRITESDGQKMGLKWPY